MGVTREPGLTNVELIVVDVITSDWSDGSRFYTFTPRFWPWHRRVRSVVTFDAVRRHRSQIAARITAHCPRVR
jgi:hypothetical protein